MKKITIQLLGLLFSLMTWGVDTVVAKGAEKKIVRSYS
jgi:hypothetical protein